MLLKIIQACAKPFFGKGLDKVGFLQSAYAGLTRLATPRKKLVNINGYKMEVNLRMGGIAHSIAFDNVYEPESTKLFISHVKNLTRKCVIDVGANIGYYSLLAATLMGDEGRVYAFEPDRSNQSFLERNIVLNKLKTVTVSPNAAADAESEVTLYLSNVEAGEHSLIKIPERKIDRTETIHTVTLDTAVKEPVGLIKIDVEGAEIKVLKGAAGMIKRYRPVLMVECWEPGLKASSYSIEDMFALLKEYGYDKILMINEHEKKSLSAQPELIREYLIKYNFSTNLFCTHSEGK